MTVKMVHVASLKHLMSSRYSCRAFTAQVVSANTIQSILEIASYSASWCNVQPWNLIVTKTLDTTDSFRHALMEHISSQNEITSDIEFPREYVGVYAERRREAGLELYKSVGILRGDTERRHEQAFENFRLFGAPHVAIITIPKQLGPYAGVDAGGFITAFLLAARAHGVATIPQAALAQYAPFIRNYFDVAADQNMVCGISFGYPDSSHPVNQFRTARARVDEFARFV